MDQDSAKLENELSRVTRDANNIMLLSLISIITLPLYLIALVYFIVYFNKRKKIKSYQSLSGIFNELKSEYPLSEEGRDADRYIAALQAKLQKP